MKKISFTIIIISFVFTFIQCSNKNDTVTPTQNYPAIEKAFGTNIDLNNLLNYANQSKPTYITKDNTLTNTITNAKATLGRVLFYDKSLSVDNTISCSSCHQQKFAFGDTAITSKGVLGGTTGRHSMRLINARFANEQKFFWDERAATLEIQTTKPIQDFSEMGFSNTNGRPGISTLITKLASIDYYKELFKFVYGDTAVTENKLQECLAQFIRSIQSFDSKYDIGRNQVSNDISDFPNFTTQENLGKNLFITSPVFDATSNRTSGGLGCGGCHAAPEFDILPTSGNNGIIGTINNTGIDVTVTRAPSLRDLVAANGNPNGPMMHTGVLTTLQQVVGHYGTINIAPGNSNLDVKLKPNNIGQKLNLNATEVNAVIAFLKTLTGTNVYTDVKWANPFK